MDEICRISRAACWIILLPALLVSSSCFVQRPHLPLADGRASEAVVDMQPGVVRFATDVEVKYSGVAVARYDVELVQHGAVVARTSCNPLHIPSSRSCSYRFGRQNFHCSFVMDCGTRLDSGGPTIVRARLSVPTRPPEFELRQADLIVGR